MLTLPIGIPANLSYPLLFALVGAESAGALLPGETSLILAAILAAQGRLSLPAVIGTAAVAAILGDNAGYLIGRRGLRRLIGARRRRQTRRERSLARGEEFFRRHGAAAVFFGRWLPGLRVFASWLAGATRMSWPRFLLWNALGGLSWASTIGSVAYLLGRSASSWSWAIGLVGLAVAGTLRLFRGLRRRGCVGEFPKSSRIARSMRRRLILLGPMLTREARDKERSDGAAKRTRIPAER